EIYRSQNFTVEIVYEQVSVCAYISEGTLYESCAYMHTPPVHTYAQDFATVSSQSFHLKHLQRLVSSSSSSSSSSRRRRRRRRMKSRGVMVILLGFGSDDGGSTPPGTINEMNGVVYVNKKDVILSIREKYMQQIIEGSKLYEVRRRLWKSP